MRGLIVVLALLLAGCTAVRKAKYVDESRMVDRTENNVTEVSGGRKLLSGRSLFDQLDEVQGRRIVRGVIYDTSRPVDPATGRPPVLCEFTVEDTTSRRTETKTRDTVAVSRADTAVRVDRTKVDVQEIKKTEVQETTKKRVPGWVWLAGIGTAICAGWWVKRRLF